MTFRQWGALLALLVALPFSLVLATGFGTADISPGAIAMILLNHTGFFHFQPTWPAYADPIIWQVRFPRVVEGALVGAALAMAGALFQGLLRNPLADPFLLGTSAGAALGATIAYVVPSFLFFAGFSIVPFFAFGGALVAIVIVYFFARVQQRTPVISLLLSGVAISTFLGAIQSILITQNPLVAERIGSLYLWLSGGIVAATWPQIGIVALLAGLGIAGGIFLAPMLDAFALGEEGAAHLGIAVEQAKILVVGIAAILVASAVTLSGLVGFVGLFIPHICRMVIGPRHRMLLPIATVLGGIAVIWADVAARSIMPFAFHSFAELPLGVITALVGGPFFLWLLQRSQTIRGKIE